MLKIESAAVGVDQLFWFVPSRIDRSRSVRSWERNEMAKIRKIARTACSGTLGPEEDEANLLGKHPSLLDLNGNNLVYMVASSTSFPLLLTFSPARHYYDFPNRRKPSPDGENEKRKKKRKKERLPNDEGERGVGKKRWIRVEY